MNATPDAVLLSTYELGHQPFGLASPAAWLRQAGAVVTCTDLAVDALDESAVRAARLIGLYTPMHTATRLAAEILPRLRRLNPDAVICCYGLYAPINEAQLRACGADHLIGGEFETTLVELYQSATDGPPASAGVELIKQAFVTPDRDGLPALDRYAHLIGADGTKRIAGYTEATRGCKHKCRHCPIVPVYDGRFFVVQSETVLDDIAAQVAAGARHISFGDPDFFNGVGHALPLVAALHRAFPDVTYDVTIKISHLLKHQAALPRLVDTGCLFVTTAAESVDDQILAVLDKGHDREDFIAAVTLGRDAGLTLAPTFIPFTPWTTVEGYIDLLALIGRLGLVSNVAPVQLAIRLLLPTGSLLLDRAELAPHLGAYDPAALGFDWSYGDHRMAALETTVCGIVGNAADGHDQRPRIFHALWEAAHDAAGVSTPRLDVKAANAMPVPRMSEPWYCCAEPTASQLARV